MAQQRNGEDDHANEWIRFGMKLAVQSVLHPFEYSKVLIQVEIEKFCLPFSYHPSSLQISKVDQ